MRYTFKHSTQFHNIKYTNTNTNRGAKRTSHAQDKRHNEEREIYQYGV